MRFVITVLFNGLLVFLAAYLLPGVSVSSFWVAIITGLIWGLVNYTVKPVITLLTLPVTVMTLGLFLIIINGLMVLLVDWLIPGFNVDGLFWAVLFSLTLAFFNFLFGKMKPD